MFKLEELEWHRAMGSLLAALDQTDFWIRLTRLLSHYVHFDSWVALTFCSHSHPLVLAEMQLNDGQVDHLFEEYKRGIYVLDPFFMATREKPRDGLVLLDEVAPDQFKLTEYYQRYFRINVVEDELQINCAIDSDLVLCLSLGSHRKFSPAELGVLSVLAFWLVPLFSQRWRYEMGASSSEFKEKAPKKLLNFRIENAQLSDRELEISKLVLSGHSSKHIAKKLGISPETVKVHRKHAYSKLGINSQSELFALFISSPPIDVAAL